MVAAGGTKNFDVESIESCDDCAQFSHSRLCNLFMFVQFGGRRRIVADVVVVSAEELRRPLRRS